MAARRADEDAAAAGRSEHASGRAPHPLEERDPGSAASQPEAAAADEQPFRRRWPRLALARQELPVDEQDTINAALRQIDFLNDEIQAIETELARFATGSAEAK